MTKQQLLTDVALQRGDMPGDGGGGHAEVLAIALGLIYRSNVVKEMESKQSEHA